MVMEKIPDVFEIRAEVRERYADVVTSRALEVLAEVAGLDGDRKTVMQARLERRRGRAQRGERIHFLDPESTIPRTGIKVADARAGRFTGSAIPEDLKCVMFIVFTNISIRIR